MGSLNVVNDYGKLLADRKQAAELLSKQLADYKDSENLIILGIPRGGVVLASELAGYLNAEMDIVLTRKIRAPYNPELAAGAVTEDGEVYLNRQIVKALGLGKDYIDSEKKNQLFEIKQRSRRYRQVLEKTPLSGKKVVLTDDGVATGATMQAAVWAVIAEFPEKVILALPVAPPDALGKLAEDADETICLSAPANFGSVSQFYADFPQTEDEEIIEILKNYSKSRSH